MSPHLFTSQALSGWMGADAHFQVSPEIFDWVYSQAVAGQLKDFHRVVYKLLCTLDHCPVGRWTTQSEVLNALDWVFIKAISIFWCIKFFFYFDMSFSPCRRKTPQQHGAATSTLYFWDGTLQVMSRAGSLQAWFLEMKFIRPENIVSHRVLLGLFICVQITSVFSCIFTEERTESYHTAIKPRLVECYSEVCLSVGFSYLHLWSWSSTRVTIKFLVTTLNKALLHQLLSLARRPALGRDLVVSNFFH